VVDTLAISNGRTIHLVALGDRVIAVGATAQQLTLLNELTEEEAATVLTENPRDAEQPLAAFAAELFQSMRRGGRQNRPGSRQTITGDDHTQATRQPR
jgi:flagellar biogenesis protein FliO